MSYRWVILCFAMLAYTTSQLARNYTTGVAKYISADLGLDKGDIGLMASAFFYAYALTQMPWGIATDRWGSRIAASAGVFLTAATLVGFSTSASTGSLVFWRIAMGIAAASVYVSMAAGLARWFPPKERGLSQATFSGLGGGMGEAMAFLLAPLIIYLSVASGWRTATLMVAGLMASIAASCVAFLRSAPPDQEVRIQSPWEWRLLAEPRLWCFTFVFAGSIIALRLVPTWLPIYAADVYMMKHGLGLNEAVAAGGVLGLFYVFGRSFGSPLAGKLSDVLIRLGIARISISILCLLLSAGLLLLLSMGITAPVLLQVIALSLGISINMWTLVTAAVSEAYGPQRTASIVGFINTFSQLCGATGLLVSGYVGISLSSQPGNAIEEYRGIWLVGMAGCLITALLGMGLNVVLRRRVRRAERLAELSRSG